MGKYVVHGLAANERAVRTTRVTAWDLFGEWILGILFCWLLLIPTVYAIAATVRWAHTELVLTNRRVVRKTGVFNVETKDIPLHQILNVNVKINLLGRILNYGTITIATAAQTYTLERIRGAELFKEAVLSEMERSKDEASLRAAQNMAMAMYTYQPPKSKDTYKKTKNKTKKKSK